jgi:hypothetical protein
MIENDFESKYLFSFVSSSSKNENISNTIDISSFIVAKTIKELFLFASSLKTTKSKH